jgi:YidC/Oxa1 family membrane protein insertase
MEGNPMTGKMKNVARGMAFLAVPFTMNFAKVRKYCNMLILS